MPLVTDTAYADTGLYMTRSNPTLLSLHICFLKLHMSVVFHKCSKEISYFLALILIQ